MSKKTFRILYGILMAFFVLCVNYAVHYVQKNINRYEEAQPKHLVEDTIFELTERVKSGTFQDMFSYPDIKLSVFDPTEGVEKLFAPYNEKISKVKYWTYNTLSGSYSEERAIYGLIGDGELLASLTLNCQNSEIILEMLTVNDWEKGNIVPKIMVTGYTMVVDIPESFSAMVNGQKLTADYEEVSVTEKGDNNIYTIKNLFALPDVVIFDRNGKICESTSDNGYVTVDAVKYNLILPENLSLYEEDKLVNGTPADGGVEYSFMSMAKSLVIKDEYGQEVEYRNGDTVYMKEVSFTVPDNYSVYFKNLNMEQFVTSEEEIKKYQYCEEYEKMPRLLTYTIPGCVKEPEMTVYDNKGEKIDYKFTNNSFKITEQAYYDEVPEYITAEFDPMAFVKLWSNYLTNDVPGANHGFDTIKEYFIEDSYFYRIAYNWSNNIDITFTSKHQTPKFILEELSNVVVFSENMFSVNARVRKSMLVTQTILEHVENEIYSTFYFYKYDGKWYLIDQADILEG